jgi:hypothetical protein
MENLKSIKFSNNWNRKLDNIIFTTIRKKGYWINWGDKAAIVLNDKVYKWVECIGKTEIPFISICGSVIATDTGLFGAEAIQIFEKLGINTLSESEPCTLLVLRSIPNPQLPSGVRNQQKTDLFNQ